MAKAKHGFLLSLIIPLLFIILWWGCALRVNNSIVLPEVNQVFSLLFRPTENLISMGSLLSNILVSLIRVMVGYILAVLVAIPMGILMGYYGIVFNMFNNFLGLFRPIPPLAWVPLVLAWFGVASFATLFGVEEGQLYIWLSNLKISMIYIYRGFFPRTYQFHLRGEKC